MSKVDQIRALRERRYQEEASRLAHATATPLSIAVNGVINLVNNVTRRQAKWRSANLETNRQRARNGMRKRRASKKDNAS